MKKVFFPNLNGIRFIAASLVVIHHIEQIKSIYGLPNHWGNKSIQIIGGLGVTLFFVLSGFLITYMLFIERDHTETISIKGFYIRRILRIWPLYFFIILLAFFVLPKFNTLNMPLFSNFLPYEFSSKLLLFIAFLPNVAALLYPPVPFASQAWSIGVEEQFYFIWPALIKLCKKPLIVLCSVILFFLTIKAIIHGLSQYNMAVQFQNKIIFAKQFLELTRINCMAIGGIGAYTLHTKNHKITKLFYSKITQSLTYISILFLIGFGVSIPYFNDEAYSILFMLTILNLASNKSTMISINNKIFDYLGKISYGIYMYHPLAIVIAIVLVKATVDSPLHTNSNLLIYFASILITTCFSAASYELLEKFFIKKKVSFSRVISGENAR